MSDADEEKSKNIDPEINLADRNEFRAVLGLPPVDPDIDDDDDDDGELSPADQAAIDELEEWAKAAMADGETSAAAPGNITDEQALDLILNDPALRAQLAVLEASVKEPRYGRKWLERILIGRRVRKDVELQIPPGMPTAERDAYLNKRRCQDYRAKKKAMRPPKKLPMTGAERKSASRARLKMANKSPEI